MTVRDSCLGHNDRIALYYTLEGDSIMLLSKIYSISKLCNMLCFVFTPVLGCPAILKDFRLDINLKKRDYV